MRPKRQAATRLLQQKTDLQSGNHPKPRRRRKFTPLRRGSLTAPKAPLLSVNQSPPFCHRKKWPGGKGTWKVAERPSGRLDSRHAGRGWPYNWLEGSARQFLSFQGPTLPLFFQVISVGNALLPEKQEKLQKFSPLRFGRAIKSFTDQPRQIWLAKWHRGRRLTKP